MFNGLTSALPVLPGVFVVGFLSALDVGKNKIRLYVVVFVVIIRYNMSNIYSTRYNHSQHSLKTNIFMNHSNT